LPELKALHAVGRGTLAIAYNDGFIETKFFAHEERKWKTISKFPFEIGFNAKYLADLCGGAAHYIDEQSPLMIKDRRGGIEKMAVIMPLRV